MAQWMGRLGFELDPLSAHVLLRIKQGLRVFADETELPTLEPGAGKAKKAYLWTYARDDRPFGGGDPPMVAYRFEDSRSGDCALRHLKGYHGILQVDGYAAYQRLARPDRGEKALLLACCWAHLRRRFYELHVAGSSSLATATVERMKDLWSVEDKVRGLTPDDRSAARRQSSAPIVAELFALWERELALISGKSKLAEHISYALERRASFELFLADGRVEIDSNIVERAIRPQTKRASLCSPSSSVCKHWERVRVSDATRAAFPGHRRFHRLRHEVGGPYLMRRAGNNLHGMKDSGFDQAPYRVACDA
jgi:transposase